MKLVKAVILLALLTLGSGCSYYQHYKKVDALTIEKVNEKCTPEEFYPSTVFGIPIVASRTKNCLGFDDMFIIGYQHKWGEFSDALTHVLMLEYIRGWNHHHDEKEHISHLFLKNEIYEEEGGFMFYKLEPVELD